MLPEGRKSINGSVVRVGEAFDRLDAEGVRSHVIQTAPAAVGPVLQDGVDMVVLDSARAIALTRMPTPPSSRARVSLRPGSPIAGR